MRLFIFTFALVLSVWSLQGQTLVDDFEGNATIMAWVGDDCSVEAPYQNTFMNASNPSPNVLRYQDNGGLYANIRFDVSTTINITAGHPFRFKIYVPSSGLSGQQANQVSLKLQNNQLAEPWATQTEVIKPIVLDQWQTVEFDFVADPFINLDPNSLDPKDRTDLNRVLIQVNGENNTDQVIAYIDDFYFEGESAGGGNDPIYDQLVWSDEFDEDGALDPSKWHHQTLLPNGDSWFNGEIQHYTDRTDNSYVDNGLLQLVAKKETYRDQGVTKAYTSARLNSKFAFTYGRVEVRAKLPTGGGTWPAIWMLGQNITEIGGYWYEQGYGTTSWPDCGEIDIMEHWGWNQNYVSSAMHTRSSFGGTVNHGGRYLETASTDFHVYTLDWFPDRMVFSVDGVVHYVYEPEEQNPDTWPFTENQYLLLNIAIEPTIDPGFTESAMEIDYVRVYQESTSSAPQAPEDIRITLSPNPTDNQLRIHTSASAIGQAVKIYNVQGQLMQSLSVKSEQTVLDVSRWAPGLYFLNLGGLRGQQSLRFIKT